MGLREVLGEVARRWRTIDDVDLGRTAPRGDVQPGAARPAGRVAGTTAGAAPAGAAPAGAAPAGAAATLRLPGLQQAVGTSFLALAALDLLGAIVAGSTSLRIVCGLAILPHAVIGACVLRYRPSERSPAPGPVSRPPADRLTS